MGRQGEKKGVEDEKGRGGRKNEITPFNNSCLYAPGVRVSVRLYVTLVIHA